MTWKMLQFMHRLQFAIAGVKPGGQQVRRVRWPLTRRRQNQASSINETSQIGRTRDKAPTTSSSFEESPAAWWRRGRSSTAVDIPHSPPLVRRVSIMQNAAARPAPHTCIRGPPSASTYHALASSADAQSWSSTSSTIQSAAVSGPPPDRPTIAAPFCPLFPSHTIAPREYAAAEC